MTARITTAQRDALRTAGFAPVTVGGRKAGWVKAGYAKQVSAQIDAWSDAVEAILARPVRPRGRPKAKP